MEYSGLSKAYRLWNPATDEIVKRYDVTIDETVKHDPTDFRPPDCTVPSVDRSPDASNPGEA